MESDKIFKFKRVNIQKLLQYGFAEQNGFYLWRQPVSDGKFLVEVRITNQGKVDYSLIDANTDEEYILVKVEHAVGTFVGEMRYICEQILTEIAENCFDTEIFKFPQTHRIIERVFRQYHREPEYLWQKTPDNAVFRHSENAKWFAAVLTTKGSNIRPSLQGNVEIIDLKTTADRVTELVDHKRVFPAYHMNKKYWLTLVLDDSLTDDEIMNLIEESFQNTL